MNVHFRGNVIVTLCTQVIDAVAKGRELGIRSKAFEKLRRLAEGPYESFLKEQRKRAKKCGHHARAVNVMVKRADMLVDKKGAVRPCSICLVMNKVCIPLHRCLTLVRSPVQSLALSKFTGLKEAEVWAAEKGTGRASRMFRGSGMLRSVVHSQQSERVPLCRIAWGEHGISDDLHRN